MLRSRQMRGVSLRRHQFSRPCENAREKNRRHGVLLIGAPLAEDYIGNSNGPYYGLVSVPVPEPGTLTRLGRRRMGCLRSGENPRIRRR